MTWILTLALPVSALQAELVKAVEKVGPAVVSITVTSRTLVSTSPFSRDPFWSFFFPPQILEREVHSLGSGIVLTPDGEILTNAHVLGEHPDSITVTFPSGEQYPAKVLGVADAYDLALLKVESSHPLPHVELGNSDSLRTGQFVIAIGNPFGYLLEDLEPTVTVGVISALHRTLKGKQERKYYNMIQTDAAINPGNSGGPLVDLEGRVVGINTFIFSSSGGSEGIGFAIPINTARRIVKELRAYGRVRPVLLGFRVQGLSPELREALGYEGQGGVLIQDVLPGHPAARFLQDGDVLVELNGHPIRNEGDFRDQTYALLAGDRMRGKVVRGGKILPFSFTLPEFRLPPVREILGARLRPVSRRMAWYYDLPVDYGLLVEQISPHSPLLGMGIREGDVILEVNGVKLQRARDLEEALQGRRLVLRVYRNGRVLLLRFWR